MSEFHWVLTILYDVFLLVVSLVCVFKGIKAAKEGDLISLVLYEGTWLATLILGGR